MHPIYTFARHGEAGQAKDNTKRQLTEKGREQGRQLGRLLGVDKGNPFDLVLHSGLDRTRDTAQSIFSVGLAAPLDMVAMPGLYAPEEGTAHYRIFMEVFNRLGAKLPLRAYLVLEQGERRTMIRFAERAASAVENAVAEHHAMRPLIVGHSVNQQNIALTICTHLGKGQDALLTETLGEGEAFILNPNAAMNQMVRFIRQPAS